MLQNYLMMPNGSLNSMGGQQAFLSVTLPGDLLAHAKLWCGDEF